MAGFGSTLLGLPGAALSAFSAGTLKAAPYLGMATGGAFLPAQGTHLDQSPYASSYVGQALLRTFDTASARINSLGQKLFLTAIEWGPYASIHADKLSAVVATIAINAGAAAFHDGFALGRTKDEQSSGAPATGVEAELAALRKRCDDLTASCRQIETLVDSASVKLGDVTEAQEAAKLIALAKRQLVMMRNGVCEGDQVKAVDLASLFPETQRPLITSLSTPAVRELARLHYSDHDWTERLIAAMMEIDINKPSTTEHMLKSVDAIRMGTPVPSIQIEEVYRRIGPDNPQSDNYGAAHELIRIGSLVASGVPVTEVGKKIYGERRGIEFSGWEYDASQHMLFFSSRPIYQRIDADAYIGGNKTVIEIKSVRNGFNEKALALLTRMFSGETVIRDVDDVDSAMHAVKFYNQVNKIGVAVRDGIINSAEYHITSEGIVQQKLFDLMTEAYPYIRIFEYSTPYQSKAEAREIISAKHVPLRYAAVDTETEATEDVTSVGNKARRQRRVNRDVLSETQAQLINGFFGDNFDALKFVETQDDEESLHLLAARAQQYSVHLREIRQALFGLTSISREAEEFVDQLAMQIDALNETPRFKFNRARHLRSFIDTEASLAMAEKLKTLWTMAAFGLDNTRRETFNESLAELLEFFARMGDSMEKQDVMELIGILERFPMMNGIQSRTFTEKEIRSRLDRFATFVSNEYRKEERELMAAIDVSLRGLERYTSAPYLPETYKRFAHGLHTDLSKLREKLSDDANAKDVSDEVNFLKNIASRIIAINEMLGELFEANDSLEGFTDDVAAIYTKLNGLATTSGDDFAAEIESSLEDVRLLHELLIADLKELSVEETAQVPLEATRSTPTPQQRTWKDIAEKKAVQLLNNILTDISYNAIGNWHTRTHELRNRMMISALNSLQKLIARNIKTAEGKPLIDDISKFIEENIKGKPSTNPFNLPVHGNIMIEFAKRYLFLTGN